MIDSKGLTLAYLAGLFDGEGTFSIQVQIRPRKSKRGGEYVNLVPRMTLTLKYGTEILETLQNQLGGSIYESADGCRRWSLGGKEALIAAATALIPYLVVKRRIAERFVEALRMWPETRHSSKPGSSSWETEKLLAVVEIALSLNDYKKSNKNAEFVDDVKRVLQAA